MTDAMSEAERAYMEFLEPVDLDEDIDGNDSVDGFVTDLNDEPEAPTEHFSEPNEKFVRADKQSRTSVAYETKMRGILQTGMVIAASDQRTVADAATIITFGPKLSRAVGDLAAHDDRIKGMVDFVTSGTDNPYGAVAAIAFPMFLQFVRNHEPVLEPAPRGIRIPFTKKRFQFRFGIKLGKMRSVTKNPSALESNVFDNPSIALALENQGIQVARNKRRD